MSDYVDLSEDNASRGGTSKTHTEYIYDIGEFPVKESNLQRFRDSYGTNRPEYSGHAFKVKFTDQDEPRTVRVPRNVAREIHLLCEAKSHPLTFHQKLQPNYITGNASHPNKVGKTKVETVVYFNGIQNAMKAPKYVQDKAWAMQNTLFEEKLQLKKLNDEGYPTIKDLDYSKPVALKMFKHVKSKKAKKSKGGVDHKTLPSRIQDSEESLLHSVLNGLPTTQQLLIDENNPGDWDEHDEDEMEDSDTERENAAELARQNAKRSGNGQIKRAKLGKGSKSKLSTNNDDRAQRVTRSMEKEKVRVERARSSRRRNSEPSGTKRKLMDDENDVEEVQSQGSELADNKTDENASFDLFAFDEVKKDWDEHPEMEKLMELGRKKMEKVGFSSPREGMGNITIQKLAKTHKVKLLKKRKPSVEVLVRALVIEKLKADDSRTSKYYEDKKTRTK